jgi:saccharopine dehydrogenase (NAD+, L-lysine forming)
MIGAAMMVRGDWQGEGVFNIEQMDPDPFMDMLNQHGLPWTVEEMDGPVGFRAENAEEQRSQRS